jgi:hypothetical protein
MFRTFISMMVVLAIAGVAFAAAPHVRSVKTTLRAPSGRAVWTVKVPQIEGTRVDAAVNRQLKALFVPPMATVVKEAAETLPKQVQSTDVDYEVTLATPTLLSLKYEGLSMPTEKGVIASAHPSKLIHSYTFDLRTGHVVPLSALFRKGTKWKARLDAIVKARNTPVDPPARYGYYLTPKKLVLTELSDIFAVASVEVPITLADLQDILDRKGPAGLLL